MAFQTAQMYFIQSGFLTTSRVHFETSMIQLTIHFTLPNMPTIPSGYVYSEKEITSHPYWLEYRKEVIYVRCLTLYFDYELSK